MKFNDAVFGAILVVRGRAVVAHDQSFPRIPGQQVGPALFPGLVALGLALCGAILIFYGLRHRDAQPWFVAESWTRSRRHVVAFVAVAGAIAFYIALAETLGFLVVGPPILFVLFVVFGVRPVRAVVVAAIAALVIWYVFYKLLRVPLPWGVLTRYAF